MNKNHDSNYCGYISIIGRSNVGKSSILNKIMTRKLSIVSNKSGTTRKNILGIQTIDNYQYIYIDTPGINNVKHYININHNFKIVAKYLTLIIFVIEKTSWCILEEQYLKKIKNIFSIPIILVINKIDLIKNKTKLLPFIYMVKEKYNFQEIIPISAKNGNNFNILLKIIKKNIPKNKHIFPKYNITNLSKKFRISEIIREKLFISLYHELPYLIKVIVNDDYINDNQEYNINAIIFIKNIEQKKIIIGKNGKKIKNCIFLAEKDIQNIFNKKKVILKLKIKVFG